MSDKPLIAVWFSCGAASAVAAKLTLDKYSDSHDVRILNSPVVEEDPDNRRFLRDVESWLGVEVESVVNAKFPACSAVEVWAQRKYMSNANGEAVCTYELKKEARRGWQAIHKPEWHVLGFTADEARRHKRFVRSEAENLLPVLIDAGLTKADCFAVLDDAGVKMPAIYAKGFPNANCIGCVKATSPSYWNLVRKHYPAEFDARAAQSREIGCKLTRIRNKRIYLDELPATASTGPVRGGWSCGVFCDPEPLGGDCDE